MKTCILSFTRYLRYLDFIYLCTIFSVSAKYYLIHLKQNWHLFSVSSERIYCKEL